MAVWIEKASAFIPFAFWINGTTKQPSDWASTLLYRCFNMNCSCALISFRKNGAPCTSPSVRMISASSQRFRRHMTAVPLLFGVSSVHSVAQHLFLPVPFSLCSVSGSLCCLTLHSHQSCCCLWIAILLWSKADLAAAQQACLWVLAVMLADLSVPAQAPFLLFVCYGKNRDRQRECVCVCVSCFYFGGWRVSWLWPALADTFIPQSDPPIPPDLWYQSLTDGAL